MQIKHVKELIDLRNPQVNGGSSRNMEETSKNFDNSSIRSGGMTTSHNGSMMGGPTFNLVG